MRDRRFVAVHRGGPLDVTKHHLLAAWVADCAEHVLRFLKGAVPTSDRDVRSRWQGRGDEARSRSAPHRRPPSEPMPLPAR
jgi:hypothetical protein